MRVAQRLCGLVLLCGVMPAQAADVAEPKLKTFTYELAADGLIPNWLALGYLPGRADEDRLAAVGGETNVTPYGGQAVVLPGTASDGSALESVWKTIGASKLEIPYYMYGGEAVTLFVDDQGQLVEDATAYLYCELESASEQELTLRLTGGEPIRIWLNVQPVPVDERARHFTGNGAQIPIILSSGGNRLLIRLENRHRDEALAPRLVEPSGKPPRDVRVSFRAVENPPAMPERYPAQDWNALISEIPPVPKSEDERFFGAHLGRIVTLLETGGQTKRPVRILFYGQSITAQEWVWFLVRRLRELYPETDIQAENWAIGGWQIHKLNRTVKHDILRARPDLVVLHAYGGSSWDWEGILQKIRRETTAEIMVRTAHVAGRDMKGYDEEGGNPIPADDASTLMIRRLARKYGCELVEVRKEWLSFMRAHGLFDRLDLCSDGLHLNRKGSILMAQLYERHFTSHPASRPWFKTVRRYEAMRPITDRRNDEIQLVGDGWNADAVNCVTSTGKDDQLKLKFYGNRVDLVMPQCAGKAKVLINGRPPSEWNLLHGTRPGSKGNVPAWLMTYYLGDNAIEEDWVLRFTHLSGDGRQYRFTLTGSRTGPDGQGDNSQLFVSNSGRITISGQDFNPSHGFEADRTKTELEPVSEELLLTWSVRQPFQDEVHGVPQREGEPWNPRYEHPYRYVTVVDGLPPGEHELTLIPVYSKNRQHFSIDAVEVHRPPLW
ncbi:MAG: SGNH/GDSL hydrolase family protein [Thermoguttaceae bacterium]|nr:SGNH/GDSL hydrolase family protein [Thermoguttaceae bacterium]